MTRMKKIITAALIAWVILAAALVVVFFRHRVETAVTKEDMVAIAQFMKLAAFTHRPEGPSDFDQQVAFIANVQEAVLKLVPGNQGIPIDMCREPANLLQSRSGLCYDRSRFLEKIFRWYGFEVRHASLYALKNEKSSVLAALLKRGGASHAVTEVLTAKGWLLVDPNAPFLSLDAKGFPVSISNMILDAESPQVIYHKRYKNVMNPFYRKPFFAVYGLYSRHGRFYPPFNVVPDIAWDEFWDNFLR